MIEVRFNRDIYRRYDTLVCAFGVLAHRQFVTLLLISPISETAHREYRTVCAYRSSPYVHYAHRAPDILSYFSVLKMYCHIIHAVYSCIKYLSLSCTAAAAHSFVKYTICSCPRCRGVGGAVPGHTHTLNPISNYKAILLI